VCVRGGDDDDRDGDGGGDDDDDAFGIIMMLTIVQNITELLFGCRITNPLCRCRRPWAPLTGCE